MFTKTVLHAVDFNVQKLIKNRIVCSAELISDS